METTVCGIFIGVTCQQNGIAAYAGKAELAAGESPVPLVITGGHTVAVTTVGLNGNAVGIGDGNGAAVNGQSPNTAVGTGNGILVHIGLHSGQPLVIIHTRCIAGADDHDIFAADKLICGGDLHIAFTGNDGLGVFRLGRLGGSRAGQIQMCRIGSLDIRGSDDREGAVSTTGTHVAIGAIQVGMQGVVLAVPCKDRNGCITKDEVQVGAADFHVDILLGAAGIHKVQVVAAIGCFQIDIHTGIHAGGGSAVVAAHSTVEVVHAGLALLLNTQLIGRADLGIGDLSRCIGNIRLCRGFGRCGNFAGQNELCSDLTGGAHGAVNVAGPGNGNGIIIAVCTHEVVACGGQVDAVNAQLAVVLPYHRGAGGYSQAATEGIATVEIFFSLDIHLGFAVHIVEANTLAGYLDHINSSSAGAVFCGLQLVAGVLTIEEQVLANVSLTQIQIICGIFAQRTVAYRTGANSVAHQSTLGVKFQLAVVVLDLTGNGNGIGLTDHIDAVTHHAVALELHAANLHGNGNVAIL